MEAGRLNNGRGPVPSLDVHILGELRHEKDSILVATWYCLV